MDHNTCFLLGAGCSLCAKKPTIDRLTEMVRDASSQAVQVLLGDIRGKGNRKANVEDLINYLLRMRPLCAKSNFVLNLISNRFALNLVIGSRRPKPQHLPILNSIKSWVSRPRTHSSPQS